MAERQISLFGNSRHHVVRWKENQVCKCDDKGHFKNNCPKQRAKVLGDSTNLRGVSPSNIVENCEHKGLCSLDSEDCHPPVHTVPVNENPMCSDMEESEIIGSDAAFEVKEKSQGDWTYNSDVYFNPASIKEFGIEKAPKVVASPAIRLKSQVAQVLGKSIEASTPITSKETPMAKICSPVSCTSPVTCVEIQVSPVPSSHSEDQPETCHRDSQFQAGIDHSNHESQFERKKLLCVNRGIFLDYFKRLEKGEQSTEELSDPTESDSDKTIQVAQSMLSPANKVVCIDRYVVESEETSTRKDDYDGGEILVYGSLCTLDLDAKIKKDKLEEAKGNETDGYEEAKVNKEDEYEERDKQRKLVEEFPQWFRYYRSRGMVYFLKDKDGKLVPMTRPMDKLQTFGEEVSCLEGLNEETSEDLDEQLPEKECHEEASCDFGSTQFAQTAHPAFGASTNRQFNTSYYGAPHFQPWQQASHSFAQGQFPPQVNPFAYSTGFMPTMMPPMMPMPVAMPAFGMSSGFANYPMPFVPAVPMPQPTTFDQFGDPQKAFGKSQRNGNFSSSQHGNAIRRMSRSQARHE